MIKFIFFVFQLAIILAIVFFVIENNFTISFEINDFIYLFSSSYFLVLMLIFILLVFLLQSLYLKSKTKIINYKNNKKLLIKEKGYNAFVEGMIALSNKDYKKALSESKKISNHLSDNPSLNLLLKSEIFKLEKKYDQLNLVYEQMLKKKNTETLGLTGMMEHYLRAQDYHHAFIYGQKLFYKNPFIEKVYDTLLNIITKTNNWHQLIQITEIAYNKKIISKRVYQENKSIAFFEIAKIKRDSNIEESIKLISKALNFRVNFPPYIIFYVEMLIEQKKFKIAKNIIKQSWIKFPYAQYSFVLEKLCISSNEELLEVVKFIIGKTSNDEESMLLLIQVLIKKKKWDHARNIIKNLLDVRPKKNVCLLMALIEEGDTNNIQKINSWKLRAENGEPSKIWICSSTLESQVQWSTLANSGYFNSLEWKQPNMLKPIEDYKKINKYD